MKKRYQIGLIVTRDRLALMRMVQRCLGWPALGTVLLHAFYVFARVASPVQQEGAMLILRYPDGTEEVVPTAQIGAEPTSIEPVPVSFRTRVH